MIVKCWREQNAGAEVIGCKKRVHFNLCRRRFPAKIAFAVKIKNAEGQKLKPVAVYPTIVWVFPHGQMYVAFSRSCLFENVAFLIV
jgi:hypothetical protein